MSLKIEKEKIIVNRSEPDITVDGRPEDYPIADQCKAAYETFTTGKIHVVKNEEGKSA